MKTKYLFLTALIGAAAILASCTPTVDASSNPYVESSTTDVSSLVSVSSELRVFTLTELAQYNGDNGTTAYIAVNGIVYDVTNASEWENGWHKDMHLAGTDATAAFADSPHAASFLDSLPIVGTLAA